MSNPTKIKKMKKLNNYEVAIKQSHWKNLLLFLKEDQYYILNSENYFKKIYNIYDSKKLNKFF